MPGIGSLRKILAYACARTKLILDHGNLLAMVGCEDMVDQRRFPRTEKPGNDRHWHSGINVLA